MPDIFPSLLPLPGQPPLTFADALRWVDADKGLTSTQRRDRRSALLSTAAHLGRPPENVPCDIAWLNDHLYGPTPKVRLVEKERERNIRTGLRAVFRDMGIHEPDPRWDPEPVMPEWEALLAQVEYPAQKACLGGLARDCTRIGIAPKAVDDALLDEWASWNKHRRLGPTTPRRAIAVAAAWNRLIDLGLIGELQRLRAPARRQPYVLPISAFSKSFQDDYRRFEEWMSGKGRKGRFSGGGRRRALQPATIKTRLFSIRQAASALVIADVAKLSDLVSLRDLVDPIDRVGDILNFFHERTGRETGSQLATVAAALHIIGVHYAHLDEASCGQLRDWRGETENPRQQGMTPSVREKLRRLIQTRPRHLLLALPAELMRRARLAGVTPVQAARMARMATIIEILLICPMRLQNLHTLRPDLHFRRLDPKGRRITHIVIDGAYVKNREPIEWEVRPENADLIEAYIRDFRPALAGPGNPYLFPGEGMETYSTSALQTAVCNVTLEEIKVRVNVHLFRHFAAWLHLKHHPGAYEDVRRILGHRSIQTTINTYVGFETEAAAERFDSVVLQERRDGRAIAAKTWGGRGRPKGNPSQGRHP